MSQVEMCRFPAVEGNPSRRTQIEGVHRSGDVGFFVVAVFFSQQNLLEVPEEFYFWFSTYI